MYQLFQLATVLCLSLLTLTARELVPVPQVFLQEIAHHREIMSGLGSGRIESVASVNGFARVLQGGKWF